ncbi:MAG: tetratricopeptide repeat protein [Casimicrobiaceae bacterium]
MTDFEKINELLGEVKNSTDADIPRYWSPIVQLFIPALKDERSESASAFYQWAKKNAAEQPLKFCYAEFLMGANYLLGENHELALPLLSKARNSFEEIGDNDGVEMCSLILGVTYRSLGNFDLALKALLKPFAYFKQTGRYPIFLEGSCNSLANINLELHNYDEAFSIFNIGYETGLKIGDVFFPIRALIGMGKAKMQLDKPDEAIEYFNRALEEAEKTKNPMNIGDALIELAVFNFRSGNLTEAEHLNKQALVIHEQEKLTGAALTCCANLGEIYIKQARWDEALEVLNKGLALAEQSKVNPKMSQVHWLLSKVYKGMNNLEQSLYHHEIFHELREKVLKEDNARKLIDAKLIFEAEQTMKENIIIKKQKKEIEDKSHQLQETIEELTLTKISRKAKGITLFVGIALIVAEDPIFSYVLGSIGPGNFWLSILAKVIVIFSLQPINIAIERFLLRRFVLKKRKRLQEEARNKAMENQSVIAT